MIIHTFNASTGRQRQVIFMDSQTDILAYTVSFRSANALKILMYLSTEERRRQTRKTMTAGVLLDLAQVLQESRELSFPVIFRGRLEAGKQMSVP